LTTELDPGAAPGISTKYTFTECIVDGDEAGIDRQDRRVELPGCKRRTANENYNCKRKLRISSLRALRGSYTLLPKIAERAA
jgi:hypothetical protein